MDSLTESKIAILGATGYIGRSLIGSAGKLGISVDAFSRDVKKAKSVFDRYDIHIDAILSYDVFLDEYYDIVINATGVGSPKKLSEDSSVVFSATEEMDRMLFLYLEKYPNTRVFNISSGSIYGLSANEPITDETKAVFDLKKNNSYSVAKLMSEVKHRSAKDCFIVDLRVFAFVSRWLDHNETFFISEVAKCLQEGSLFHTTSTDMIRDYCSADDLWDVIDFLTEQPKMNAAFDIKSLLPATKLAILEHLSKIYGLKYQLSEIKITGSITGEKKAYYSKSSQLTNLGYAPNNTTLDNIEKELEVFTNKKR